MCKGNELWKINNPSVVYRPINISIKHTKTSRDVPETNIDLRPNSKGFQKYLFAKKFWKPVPMLLARTP